MRDDPPPTPPELARRAFIRTTGQAAAVAVTAGYSSALPAEADKPTGAVMGAAVEGAVPITLRINGKAQKGTRSKANESGSLD